MPSRLANWMFSPVDNFFRSGNQLRGIAQNLSEEDDNCTVGMDDKSMMENFITGSEREKLLRLLGHWEEPENAYNNNHVSTGARMSVSVDLVGRSL